MSMQETHWHHPEAALCVLEILGELLDPSGVWKRQLPWPSSRGARRKHPQPTAWRLSAQSQRLWSKSSSLFNLLISSLTAWTMRAASFQVTTELESGAAIQRGWRRPLTETFQHSNKTHKLKPTVQKAAPGNAAWELNRSWQRWWQMPPSLCVQKQSQQVRESNSYFSFTTCGAQSGTECPVWISLLQNTDKQAEIQQNGAGWWGRCST